MTKNTAQPATRLARLLARMIDGAIVGIPVSMVIQSAIAKLPFEVLMDSTMPDEARIAVLLPTIFHTYLIVAVVALAIFIVQAVFLTRDGQTLGKKALGIRIVLKDTGKNGGFSANVLLRCLVNGLLKAVPLYALIDMLFIFHDDRRCVHDMLAGTVVVKA